MSGGLRRAALVCAALLVLPLLTGVALKRAGPAGLQRIAAPAHPDFNGEWRLDVAHSQCGGPEHTPRERTDRIVHRDPDLAVRSLTVRPAGDSLKLEYRYRTNGASVNQAMGQDVHTTARWDGAALLLSSHTKMLMMDLAVDERWTLAADGRTLTETRASKGPSGEVKQTLVFRKR